MEKTVIFGASKLGEQAYQILHYDYEIVAFIDNDEKKHGKLLNGLKIYGVDYLLKHEVNIIIASMYKNEISKQLKGIGITNFSMFEYSVKQYFPIKVRYSSTGKLLQSVENNQIYDIAFLNWGSNLLDYLVLRAIAQKIRAIRYLEIGTWIGESISAVSDIVERCYSISLEDKELENVFHAKCNKLNFSRYLSYRKQNVQHFFEDSERFDFNQIDTPNLVFIDGDHSYEGVSIDTRNIFGKCGFDNSVIVWHDFYDHVNQKPGVAYSPVMNQIPQKYHENMFIFRNTSCGVYIPSKYQSLLVYGEYENELITYELDVKAKINFHSLV